MIRIGIPVLIATLVAGAVCAGGKYPWHRRIGRNVDTLHLTAHRNTPIELWPKEPESPAPVNLSRFQAALGELCGNVPRRVPEHRLERFSRFITERAAQFEIDPFLLAGLVYDRSGCWPTTPKRDVKVGRFGLTRIPVKMHARSIKDSAYTYYIHDGEKWVPKSLVLDEHRFNRYTAAKPDPNIYFAAAFLKILKEQDSHLDLAFNSVPHRHYISHWFYGDRVHQVEPENRVLRARRRMISYYNGEKPEAVGEFNGTPIFSPMDGGPRLSIDYFGNRRGKKTGYGHRGIDIDGHEGEPVRAMADGIVTFSGVDKEGGGKHEILEPKEANALANDQMGPGGLYVHINHGDGFGTIYMHLKTLEVSYRQEVLAGDVIGTIGRSGTKTPGPHLHLEMRHGTDRVDPAVYLDRVLVNPYKKNN